MESFADWLDRLAAPGPDPGGGAAAATMLALGAALTAKVASYPSRVGAELTTVRVGADVLRRRALDLVVADGAASARLVAAWRAGSPDLGAAALAAAATSEDLLRVAAAAEPLLGELAERGSAALQADVAAAAAAYGGAARIALVNLVANRELAADDLDRPARARSEGLIARLDVLARIAG